MAETEQEVRQGGGASSDDEFETVVRKRHSQSNANGQKFRTGGGGMDYNGGGGGASSGAGRGGRERERDRDFRTSSNSRNFRRRNFRERDFHSEHRRYEERDRDKQKLNHTTLPSQQQPPTPTTTNQTSASIITTHHNNTNGHRGGPPHHHHNYNMHMTLKSSSLVVTNGSVCSESGSSSESSVHPSSSSNSNGLLDIIVDQQMNHSRHVSGSGGSISGSASICDTDLLAQIHEESKPLVVVVAPPPSVNPWRVNPNAASVIAKKSPAFHKVPEPEIVKAQILDIGNRTQENTVPPRSSSAGGNGRPKNTQNNNKENHKKNIIMPFSNNNTRSNKPDLKLDLLAHDMGNQVKSNVVSLQDVAESSSENGAASSPNLDKSTSGASCDDSSSLQSDVIPQSPSEEVQIAHSELIIAPAPLPEVNPWHVNKNAVSVITKRIGQTSLPPLAQPLPVGPTPSQLPVENKKTPKTDVPTSRPSAKTTKPLTVSNAAKPQKTFESKLISNASHAANSTSASESKTPPEQISVQQHPSLVGAGEDVTDGLAQSQILQNKDIQPPQGPKFRRGFAEITKHHKGISSNRSLSSTRNSPEDWPSLQATVVESVVVQPQAKPVISLSVAPTEKKMTGANRGEAAAATTSNTATSSSDSDDIPGLQKERPLPSDNWPLVGNTNNCNKESSLESGWHSGSDLNNEDTPSEASSGEMNNKDLPDEGNSANQSENGSLTSSEDQGVVDNELEADASGASKKGKKLKQKWVKLELPETPSAKSRSRQERQTMEKEKATKEMDSHHQNDTKPPKSKPPPTNNNNNKDAVNSHKLTNGPTNDARSNNNTTYPPRGRGRAGGVRGRSGGRGGRGNQYWGGYRENSATDSIITPQHQEPLCEEYQEFSSNDYTTLPPLYPMTEFVMPYANDPYFPTPQQTSYTPPQVDDVQLSSGYVPVEDNVVLDMVKKQIEYYFSEENLAKDFYLRRKMDPEGFLPLHFIATFPRVKIMTQETAIVIQAIQASQQLELSEDFVYVRTRKTPEKWPIINDPQVPLPMPLSSSCVTYSNGYDLLSGDSTLSPTSTTLNPEVPEFVPKSNINVSLTA